MPDIEQTLKPVFVRSNGGTRVDAFADRVLFKLVGSETDDTLCLAHITSAAGTGVPLHAHTREDETFIIIEGKFIFTVDGVERVAESGDILFVPRGVPHKYKVSDDGPGKLYMITNPAGFDRFFVESAEYFAGGEVHCQALEEICERYGIRLLEPLA